MRELRLDGSSKRKVTLTACLFMGLSHVLYLKQYVKGVMFALVETVLLVFSPVVVQKVMDLISLGSPQPDVAIKYRDNSIFMLIDGVILLALVAVFVAMYAISVRSARADYESWCANGGQGSGGRNVLASLGSRAFPLMGLAPTVLMVLFFVVVPLVFSALVAFTNYSTPDHIPPNNTVDWVGLQNFKDMFGGEQAWTSALGRVAAWTFVWAILATVTCYFGGMIMAVVLQESRIFGKPVFRAIFILPYAVPSVISMLVWQNLLNGSFGTINRTLMALGLISEAIPWLSDPWLVKFTAVMVNLWAGFPYFMLMIMGTMTAISSDVYEAARIDGASKFQTFRKVTLPLVTYQTMPLLIMSFTHNINNFGAIFFLTPTGTPAVADTTTTSATGIDILVTWIYQLTVNRMKYNYASVLAVMIFVIITPFAIWQFRRTKSYKEGEV